MKKRKAAFCAVLVAVVLTLCSCNKGLTDFNYKYTYARIYLGNNLVVEGAVEKWWDYENSDMVQVQIDGKVYLTHSANVLFEG